MNELKAVIATAITSLEGRRDHHLLSTVGFAGYRRCLSAARRLDVVDRRPGADRIGRGAKGVGPVYRQRRRRDRRSGDGSGQRDRFRHLPARGAVFACQCRSCRCPRRRPRRIVDGCAGLRARSTSSSPIRLMCQRRRAAIWTSIPPSAGPARAWNAGRDGRMVLDPLCSSAAGLVGRRWLACCWCTRR